MTNLIIFGLTFYILLLSVIGYGLIFYGLCFESFKDLGDKNTIFIGFYGLLFITFISLITSLFVPHNFMHNLILHSIGVLFFIFHKAENKIEYLKNIFFISLFLFSALLISKTHDDFSFYHFTFTKYLTEQKVIFGMGLMGHGYKFISSLFFLNSSFYLPFIEYYSYNFTNLYFLIFFNFFILREIITKKTPEIIKILYLFAFVFFNLSFTRLAEYGTDKAGQLLIVILIIKLFHYVFFDSDKNKIEKLLFLIPLFGFSISLKTYFIPYIIFGAVIFLLNNNIFKNFILLLYSKSFLVFISVLILYFFHHFISTGCLISPMSFTCLGDNLKWAHDAESYKRLSHYLEQWSKAGATPNYRVENPEVYIQYFNWVPNWIENYASGKLFEQLQLLLAVFLIIFIFVKKFKFKSEKLVFKNNIIFFYLIVFVIFSIWFINHPTLRYGGYPAIFLTLAFPFAFLFQKLENKQFFDKNLKFIIILVIVAFNFKNITRVNKEFNRSDLYRFDNFPFFALPEKKFVAEKFSAGLTIYRTDGHCWNVPTPCIGNLSSEVNVKKKHGYYIIYK